MLLMLVLLYLQSSLYCLRLILDKTIYGAENKQPKVGELICGSVCMSAKPAVTICDCFLSHANQIHSGVIPFLHPVQILLLHNVAVGANTGNCFQAVTAHTLNIPNLDHKHEARQSFCNVKVLVHQPLSDHTVKNLLLKWKMGRGLGSSVSIWLLYY